MRKKKL